MKTVCWLTNIASPYKMEMLSLLSKDINLIILLNDDASIGRNDGWYSREHGNAELVTVEKNYRKQIIELAKRCDVLIDSMYATSVGIYAVSCFRFYRKKVFIHADGGIPRKLPLHQNAGVRLFMNRHHYALSSGNVTDRYFRYYGFPQKRIFHYRFSSLNRETIQKHQEMRLAKEKYREELGLGNTFTFISVGRALYRKGFDILLKAYKESGLDTVSQLLIVGGEATPDLNALIQSNDIKNVTFYPFINSADLDKYYAASDAFILCTREEIWGLVINEALSFSLPVIVSDNCVAGEEFRDLGEDVVLLPNEDVSAYATAMLEQYNNPHISTLGASAEYNIENTAADILKILESI